MASSCERRALRIFAESLGFSVTRTAGGHIRCQLPGQPPVFVSYSPSDWRGWIKARVQLRRTAAEAARAR